MTAQRQKMIKQLSEKYKLTAGSIDNVLMLLGVGYGLNLDQIEQYLVLGEGKLMEKHLTMLCLVLGVEKSDKDSDGDGDTDSVKSILEDYSTEHLKIILKNHYVPDMGEPKKYELLSQYILNSRELSAAQIEQLRLAAKAGMPEKDVLVLAKSGKNTMEIKKSVEFYEMVHETEKE